MTLGRLLLAWLPVAVWFTVVHGLLRRQTGPRDRIRIAGKAVSESLVLTLLASLWFDTLGSGVWWLPVMLVGCLVAIAGVPTALAPQPQPRRTAVLLFFLTVLRYLGAGAILVWRLG